MNIQKRNQLLSDRRDFVELINDLNRVLYNQDKLVCYGQITVQEAKNNIKEFENRIQHYRKLITLVEEQLERLVGRPILFNY